MPPPLKGPALFDRLSTPRNGRYVAERAFTSDDRSRNERLIAERKLLVQEVVRCESEMEARSDSHAAHLQKLQMDIGLQAERSRKIELASNAARMETSAANASNEAEAERMRSLVAALRAQIAALKARPLLSELPLDDGAWAKPEPDDRNAAEATRAQSILQKRVATLEVERQRLQTAANTARADKAKLGKELSVLQTEHGRYREELIEIKRRLREVNTAADAERNARDEER